jgi:hypothetical protein
MTEIRNVLKIQKFEIQNSLLVFCARGGTRPVPQMGTGRPEPIYVVRGEPTP